MLKVETPDWAGIGKAQLDPKKSLILKRTYNILLFFIIFPFLLFSSQAVLILEKSRQAELQMNTSRLGLVLQGVHIKH